MNEPVSPPRNPINPYPSGGIVYQQPQYQYASSNASNTPTKLKSWYSNDIFKVVAFFILVISVLGVTTYAFYADKLSSDQYLGVISGLLMMSLPSPLQSIKKKPKKVIIQQVTNPV